MSDLNSEVIGGRSLRNRKSLAAKNKGKSLDDFRFRWLEKCYRDRESGMNSFDFQPSKMKLVLV